ncbi:unnamed protein product [Spirodela intermedia]|uniref:U-box domain-containing protein 12 n=1 Tax=Spirodela intermedia TaxID=51605 RepID=A0A7I8KUF4_SPIIN|nr:unnamed protein product [Spirodela intermedia]
MFSDIYSTVYSANCKELAKINSPAPVDGDSQKLMVRVGEANNPKPPGDDPEQTSPRTSKDLKDSTLEDGHKVDSPVAGSSEECKKADPLVAPSDFLCPISLDLMRDPVVVSTGQTYERSSIQRWIDSGNLSCPKTQQRLQNLALTPNYVLRSLIIQWCEANSVEQRRRVRKSDGSYREVAGDSELIGELVRRLSGGSVVAQRAAAEEIRSLARRSTDNRILIAEAGAVPVLVGLLAAGDAATQEHAVTALLNLSICDSNKALIILSGAVGPIVQVLRTGSMEARENAAFALFSLSLDDENKVVIGSSPGVFEALVALLRDGSARGRRDAATALFNLCIYSGNKPRAVHAGVLAPVLWLFENPAADMVDEAVALLSVVVSHQEGKAAAARANVIPLLVEVLRAGQPQVKENAAAVLLTLCKKDAEGLGSLEGLGAVKLLAELAHSGTDRARRKAAGLLEQLKKLRRPS